MSHEQDIYWLNGRPGLVTSEYFEGNTRPWEVDAAKNFGMMFYRKLEPGQHIVGVNVGLYIAATGTPIEGAATGGAFSVFMLENRLALAALQEKVNQQGQYDSRTYNAVLANSQGRAFRGGLTAASTDVREVYFSNFGKGWPVGRSRRPPHVSPYLFVQWEVNTNEFATPHAAMDVWRPLDWGTKHGLENE